MFSGRRLLIATRHAKEEVIAPILEKELGVHCFTMPHFDTDAFGTFSGEVERKQGPLETARLKCLMAMEAAGCDLAIASEGSFGPHPSLYFVPADEEWLLLVDKQNELEIVEREISTETNFSGAEGIRTEADLRAFAHKAGFPGHALILRKTKDDYSTIIKGITTEEELLRAFWQLLPARGSVYVETDMRAMMNPARMKVISQLTHKLVKKIQSRCPACAAPGFGITGAKPGLPCSFCSFPTQSIQSYLYTCQKCRFTQEEWYPKGKRTEDPMYCDNCNP